jgi:hypothetical protein
MGDCVFAAGLGSALMQPSLSHRAIDNVPLNPFAIWASKCSQVLACAAWFNRREFHWRTASRTLWTLILFIEHGVALSSAL